MTITPKPKKKTFAKIHGPVMEKRGNVISFRTALRHATIGKIYATIQYVITKSNIRWDAKEIFQNFLRPEFDQNEPKMRQGKGWCRQMWLGAIA